MNNFTDSQKYMRMAIEEAKKSKEFVGCGVVIVRNEEVLAITTNHQREYNNATAHAEIIAIGEAGKKIGNKNLVDCEAYCTCEPCSMCLSAMIFAKVKKLYYGASMKETFPDNLPIALSSADLLNTAEHKIEIVSGVLKEECLTLIKVV